MAHALNEFKRVVLISFITLAYGHNLPLSERERALQGYRQTMKLISKLDF